MTFQDRVTIVESDESLTFGNHRFSITISKTHGEWLSLKADGREFLNYRTVPQVPVDFKVDGQWQVEAHGCRYLDYEMAQDSPRPALRVHLGVHAMPVSFGVPASLLARAPQDRYEYQLTCTYTMDPAAMMLRRTISVTRRQDVNYAGVRSLRF